jgi:hypothetical protein
MEIAMLYMWNSGKAEVQPSATLGSRIQLERETKHVVILWIVSTVHSVRRCDARSSTR